MGVAVMARTSGSETTAVGAGLAHQFEALLDAEAMLLVDDDEAEVGEVGLVLLQGVGADDELRHRRA